MKLNKQLRDQNRIKLVFFLICLLVFSQNSFAESFSCSILLSRDLKAFVPAPRPKRGNRLNPAKLEKWVKAHKDFGPGYLELAEFLAKNIELYSQQEFEFFLKQAGRKFFREIGPEQDYFIVAGEPADKSPLWTARLLLELFPDRPPKDLLIYPSKEVFWKYMSENPNVVPLVVDDASYMGQSVEEGLNGLFDRLNLSHIPFSSYINSKTGVMQKAEVHVLVGAIAAEAKRNLTRLGVPLHWSLEMPSVEDLINTLEDTDKRRRLKKTFVAQYGDFALDLVLTGFAHKTADMASVVGMSADEDFSQAVGLKDGRVFNPKDGAYGMTVLEGVLLGPDNLYRRTLPILDAEPKPYGKGRE